MLLPDVYGARSATKNSKFEFPVSPFGSTPSSFAYRVITLSASRASCTRAARSVSRFVTSERSSAVRARRALIMPASSASAAVTPRRASCATVRPSTPSLSGLFPWIKSIRSDVAFARSCKPETVVMSPLPRSFATIS